jgi:hypothetical protein
MRFENHVRLDDRSHRSVLSAFPNCGEGLSGHCAREFPHSTQQPRGLVLRDKTKRALVAQLMK